MTSWSTVPKLFPVKPWGALGLVLARLDFTTTVHASVPGSLNTAVSNGHLTFANGVYTITPTGVALLPWVRL